MRNIQSKDGLLGIHTHTKYAHAQHTHAHAHTQRLQQKQKQKQKILNSSHRKATWMQHSSLFLSLFLSRATLSWLSSSGEKASTRDEEISRLGNKIVTLCLYLLVRLRQSRRTRANLCFRLEIRTEL